MSQLWLQAVNCLIEADKVTKVVDNQEWATAYGSQQVATGIHEWKIKIVKSDAALIGITTSVNDINDDSEDSFDQRTGSYAYYSKSGRKLASTKPSAYGEASSNGDVITVHLDFDNNTLAFSKNDEFLGIAFDNIASQKPCRLAVSIITEVHAFEMTSYVNVSAEQTEAEPEHKTNYIEEVAEMSSDLTKQLKDLKGKYPTDKMKRLSIKELMDSATYLSQVNDEVQTLKVVMQTYEAQLLETQNAIKRLMNVDVRTYQKWNMKQVEIWLNGLENGRYKAYIPKLLAGFTNDGITATDLPDLDQGDLRSFGVEQFKDRKDLRNIFQGLKEANEGMTAAATAYI
eukprot:491547_1